MRSLILGASRPPSQRRPARTRAGALRSMRTRREHFSADHAWAWVLWNCVTLLCTPAAFPHVLPLGVAPSVEGASRLATLNPITRVLGWSPYVQVIWPNARRVIAVVQNVSVERLTHDDLHHHAMGIALTEPLTFGRSKHPVSVALATAGPLPASVWVSHDIAGPTQELNGWNGTQASSSVARNHIRRERSTASNRAEHHRVQQSHRHMLHRAFSERTVPCA